MPRITLGITLIREVALMGACLSDDERLRDVSASDFQDGVVCEAIAAAKRIRANGPNPADIATLVAAFRSLFGVEGDGKLIDLLAAKVKAETAAYAKRSAFRRLHADYLAKRITEATFFAEIAKL